MHKFYEAFVSSNGGTSYLQPTWTHMSGKVLYSKADRRNENTIPNILPGRPLRTVVIELMRVASKAP